MSMQVKIPKLGLAMTEGTLVEWLVEDGQRVEVGDPLYRLETDKVENDVEAAVSGVIRHAAMAGETYAVGTTIGEIE